MLGKKIPDVLLYEMVRPDLPSQRIAALCRIGEVWIRERVL